MAYKQTNNIMIENARLIFKNFCFARRNIKFKSWYERYRYRGE